jgi:hypothetical protein
MMTKLLLLGLLALVGCGEMDDGFVTVGLTDEETVSVQIALDQWCGGSEERMCSRLNPKGTSSIGLTAALGNSHTAEAYRNEGVTQILVADDRANPQWLDCFGTNILHELGHHFRGSGHLDMDPLQNVMVQKGNPCGGTLSEADISGALVLP